MHFYTKTKDGTIEPRHFVPMTKDPSRTRASRVTDAKKAAENGEVWLPSVTTILNILDKPALINWKVDKHLEQAYENKVNHRLGEYCDDYIKRIKAITREKMDEAPKAGTAIHEVLEDYIGKGKRPLDKTELLICKNVEAALIEHCGDIGQFECEKYFVSDKGYAGCADLSSPEWIIDYKSKKESAKFNPGKMAYPDHRRQLGAYGKALCCEGFKAANIFICLETGEVDFHEHTPEQIEDGYLDFLDCLSIHQRNNYNPLQYTNK